MLRTGLLLECINIRSVKKMRVDCATYVVYVHASLGRAGAYEDPKISIPGRRASPLEVNGLLSHLTTFHARLSCDPA